MTTKCTVFWRKDVPLEAIEAIRKQFGIPHYTTLNGESPCEVDGGQMELLKECERRGFLRIRPRKWRKNGDLFTW